MHPESQATKKAAMQLTHPMVVAKGKASALVTVGKWPGAEAYCPSLESQISSKGLDAQAAEKTVCIYQISHHSSTLAALFSRYSPAQISL